MNKFLNYCDNAFKAYFYFVLSFFISCSILLLVAGMTEGQEPIVAISIFKDLIVLAVGAGITLIPISKNEHFTTKQQKNVFISGCILVISAIFMLLTITFLAAGIQNQNTSLSNAGYWAFLVSILFFSLGCSLLFSTLVSAIFTIIPRK